MDMLNKAWTKSCPWTHRTKPVLHLKESNLRLCPELHVNSSFPPPPFIPFIVKYFSWLWVVWNYGGWMWENRRKKTGLKVGLKTKPEKEWISLLATLTHYLRDIWLPMLKSFMLSTGANPKQIPVFQSLFTGSWKGQRSLFAKNLTGWKSFSTCATFCSDSHSCWERHLLNC